MEKKDNFMTIGVCDDSKEAQQQVILLVEEYQKKIPQIIQILCFSSAQELLYNQKNLDLLFLDIELGDDSSGIDLVPIIRQRCSGIIVVFISSHLQYVVHSHRLRVFQFLSKPFDRQIFFEELDRFFYKFEQKRAVYQITKKGKKPIEFPICEILYIEASLRHLLIYHSKSGKHEKFGQISKEEIILTPYGFIRCHNGYLVNARYIDEIKNLTVFLTNPTDGQVLDIPISKSRMKETRRLYHQWLLEQEE